MYLSRIRLNTESRNTQIALVSPNKFHGAVEEAFSQRQKRNLWRIDRLKGQMYLLILSEEKPELKGIIDQFGFLEDPGEIKDYSVLLNRVTTGSKWYFRLVANPTYTVHTGENRGKVVAHVSEKYQMEWLLKKADMNGFRIWNETTKIVASEWKNFKKKDQRARVRIKAAAFEGVLEVTDEKVFRETLIQGIGREKAYGMGLMTIVSI